ncbi:uncharacterized protein LOC128328362 isoform X1 [Hemicordylus capensis]|uniref:uncharacterized protein LOC128328362 isoform X1 n=1 Tax=Hemicordylus capensis TaxID=884348 RepID=UPI002302C1CF|nr:uncharacterized protein LOC128328362 isoform X1 [Hemicordylus capensis]
MGPKKAPVKKAPVKKGGKAPAKKGGKPTRPPKRPNAPAESSSDDEGDLELGAIRAFIARLQALERQRTTLEGDEAGGGPSGVPPHAKKSNRAEKKAKLMQGFADRLAALEAAAGTAHEEPAGITTQPADSGPGDGRDDNDAALPEAGTWSHQGARAGARMVVEPWDVEAFRAIQASIAPRTRVAYDKRVRAFLQFRAQVGLVHVWPVPPEQLMQYLVHLHAQGLAVSTMAGHLAALAFFGKARGLPDHSGDFRVRRMLEGWARETPVQPDRRRPVTPEALQLALRQLAGVCASPYEEVLFRAAALVAFFGAFRVGEMFPRSRRGPTSRVLQISDLTMGASRVVLHLRFSKTDQRGKGQSVALHAAGDPGLCPVRALEDYTEARGSAMGCLFIHANGRHVTQFQFWAVMRRAFVAAGVPTQDLAPHSFRIGAASMAARMGYSGPEIRRLGRWRSAAYRRYVR